MVGLLLNAFSRGPKDFAAGVELRTKENAMRRMDELQQQQLEQARRQEAAAAMASDRTTKFLDNLGPGLRLPGGYTVNEDGTTQGSQFVDPNVVQVPNPETQQVFADVGKTITTQPVKPADKNQTILARNNLRVSQTDIDMLVRTVWGEARGASIKGQQDVANVIMNRAIRSGQPISQVVKAKGQFEPWGNRRIRAEMQSLDRNSPAYRRIEQALMPLLTGQMGDTTGGATLFLSPGAQRSLGRAIPKWANPKNKTLERDGHQFFTGGFRGDKRLRAGVGVPSTPPSAEEVSSPQAFTQQVSNVETAPQVMERWVPTLLGERNRPDREIQMHLQKREELVAQAREAAVARDTAAQRTLMAEIRTIDNNMVMLHGLQGVQDARRGDFTKLLSTMSFLEGRTFTMQVLSNGNINLLVEDQPVPGMQNVSPNEVIKDGLMTFSEPYRTAAAAIQAKAAEAQATENAKIPGKQLEANSAILQNRERIAGENQRAGLQSKTSLTQTQMQAQSAQNVATIQGNNDLRKASFEAQLKVSQPDYEVKEVGAGPNGEAMVIIMNKNNPNDIRQLSTVEFRKFLGKPRFETSVKPIASQGGFD